MSTLQHLREVLVTEFEIEPELITPDAYLVDDLDIDSIDAVDILVRLRELTGKNLEAESLKDIHTVADVVALIGDS